jgi:hypothetical protein
MEQQKYNATKSLAFLQIEPSQHCCKLERSINFSRSAVRHIRNTIWNASSAACLYEIKFAKLRDQAMPLHHPTKFSSHHHPLSSHLAIVISTFMAQVRKTDRI